MRLDECLKNVRVGEENSLSVINKVGEGGDVEKVVTMVNRKVIPERVLVGYRRTHIFQGFRGFDEYLKKNGSPKHLVVLVDPEEMSMTAALNETSAQPTVVSYKGSYHPAFEPWINACVHPVGIDDFAKFLLSHHGAIKQGHRGTHTMDPMALMAAMRSIRISKEYKIVSDAYAEQGKHESGYSLKTNIASEAFELPDRIELLVPILCDDTDDTQVMVDVFYDLSHDNVVRVDLVIERLKSILVYKLSALMNDLKTNHETAIIEFGKYRLNAFDYVSVEDDPGD